MAKDLGSQNEAYEEGRSSSEPHHRYLDSQLSATTDGSSRAVTPIADAYHEFLHSRTPSETIELFQDSVDHARRQMQQGADGQKISPNVPLSLTVDLSRKSLETLPEEIASIIKKNVERIVLSHNRIQSLPFGFAECINITYLNLRANQFSEFPGALFTLQKLQVLDISRNELVQLPEELRSMKSLRFLSVMNNRLQSLPYSLGFLESLRLLKLGSNPLNGALRSLVDGHDFSISPTNSNISENEKEALITVKVKQYLRSEATTLESPADSSGESPLDTPKPLKRTSTTLRFPVVPTNGHGESINDQRSPGYFKPPIPNRSHYRLPSGQNSAFPKSSFRRADIAPLLINNERLRSNSESTLESTQSAVRSKRMAIMSKQPNTLQPPGEFDGDSSSLHSRGASHSSALKERHQRAFRPGLGSSSSHSTSPSEDNSQGILVRRLSSVPERRRRAAPSNVMVEGAKGLAFGLNIVHPTMELLLSLAGNGLTKRSSLERAYYNASAQTNKLDQELAVYDSVKSKGNRRRKKTLDSVRSKCKADIVIYRQLLDLLAQNGRSVSARADHRYFRMLQFLLFYSSTETTNARLPFHQLDAPRAPQPPVTRPPKLTLLPSTTTLMDKARTAPAPRRLRSDTMNSMKNQPGYSKSAANPQSALTVYLNGRSRSNSRSNTYANSNISSLVNTPRSGESFLIPGTPALPGFDGNAAMSYSDSYGSGQDSSFEKIYLHFDKAVSRGLSALPNIVRQFGNRCDEQVRIGNKPYADMWIRLGTRALNCMETCEALRARLSTVKLKDPEIRNSREFWHDARRFIKAFVKLGDSLRKETVQNRLEMIKTDAQRVLKPVYVYIKKAASDVRESPWSSELDSPSPPQTAISTSSSNWPSGGNHTFTTQPSAYRLNGHQRKNDSFPSPYMPTTPLSAALGPAAQATIPSSSTSFSTASTMFDRSFQGDVFQRADQLLSLQPGLRDGRR